MQTVARTDWTNRHDRNLVQQIPEAKWSRTRIGTTQMQHNQVVYGWRVTHGPHAGVGKDTKNRLTSESECFLLLFALARTMFVDPSSKTDWVGVPLCRSPDNRCPHRGLAKDVDLATQGNIANTHCNLDATATECGTRLFRSQEIRTCCVEETEQMQMDTVHMLTG